MLHTMAKTDRIDLAIFDRRPGVHRHWVGVVQEFHVRGTYFADILAEVEDHRDVALTIKNAASTDGVAHALVDPVFQRNGDVVSIGLQTTHANATDDISSPLECPPSVSRCRDFGRQIIGLNDRLEDLADHAEIVLAEIRQSDFDIAKLRHTQNVGKQLFGEADASCTDDSDFETHILRPPGGNPFRTRDVIRDGRGKRRTIK